MATRDPSDDGVDARATTDGGAGTLRRAGTNTDTAAGPATAPDFLALCRGVEAGEVIRTRTDAIGRALSRATDGSLNVVWLQGQSCTGCTISLLQGEFPALEGVLSEFREGSSFHSTLMSDAGPTAMDTIPTEPDLLIVEGAIPTEIPRAATLGTDERGERKPVLDWVIELGEAADIVFAVGSCAAYGGLPAAGRHDSDEVGADPTGARGIQFDGETAGGVFGPDFRTGRDLPVVNVPGCPAHPEHVLLTLATLLNGHDPILDEYNRPLPLFGPLVHDECDLRDDYECGEFADNPGEDGCLYEAGCAGVYASCDDSVRLRNGGTTICRAVGAPCIGCVEPAFWDRFTPFYEAGRDVGPTPDQPAVLDGAATRADAAATDGAGSRSTSASSPTPDTGSGGRADAASTDVDGADRTDDGTDAGLVGVDIGAGVGGSGSDRRPEMHGVGLVVGALACLVLAPALPVVGAVAGLSRWLEDDEPTGWES
jgi:hydrogenase small subunit